MTAVERLLSRTLVAVTAVAAAALVAGQRHEAASTPTAAVAAASTPRSTGEPTLRVSVRPAALPAASARVPRLTAPVVRVRRPSRPAAPKPVMRVTSKPTPRVSAAELKRTGCDGGSGWVQRRGAYALSTLSYDWKQLGYSIVFLSGRSGITGMTYMRAKRIEIYIRPCARMTRAYLAETIAHEIGHAIDFSRGTDTWHRQWQVARGISLSIPWYGANGVSDFFTPAGDFAETFAAWQVPDGPDDSHWGRPSRAALRSLVPLMLI